MSPRIVQLAARERGRDRGIAQSRLECPFIAGHACPSGSMGFPQNWQVGRPRSADLRRRGARARASVRAWPTAGWSRARRRGASAGRRPPRPPAGTPRPRAGRGRAPGRSRSTGGRRATEGRAVSSSSSSLVAGPVPVSTSRSASRSRTEAASSCDLLLLHDHADQSLAVPRLEVEGAEPGLADGVGGDAIDGSEVHRGLSSQVLPRTRGPRRGLLPRRRSRRRPESGEASGVVDQEHVRAAAGAELHHRDRRRVDRRCAGTRPAGCPGKWLRSMPRRCRRAWRPRRGRAGAGARSHRRPRRPGPAPRRSSRRRPGSGRWTASAAPPPSAWSGAGGRAACPSRSRRPSRSDPGVRSP